MKFPVTCSLTETSLSDIFTKLLEKKISAMPIVTPTGAVVGVISKKDILQYVFRGENISAIKSGDAIDRNVVTAEINASIKAITRHLVLEQLDCIPIIEYGKLVGIITPHDILKKLTIKASGFMTVTKKQNAP